jgi:hypothetical protein
VTAEREERKVLSGLEQVAIAAYALGQMDSQLSFVDDPEIEYEVPGAIRESFEGAAAFFAGVLRSYDLSEERYNRAEQYRVEK